MMREAADYLERRLDENIAQLQAFIRQPTVSTQDIGIIDGAWMVHGYLRDAGFDEVELVETEGYPGVWAAIDAGAAKTIVSYGFWDSRPVGPRPWTYRPFGGAVVDDPDHGRVLVGRGASSPKGPLLAWIQSLKAMIQTQTLPVNVMLLLEGEEIMASPHYPAMFERYRHRFEKADAVFAGGMSQSATGGVSVNLGFRGFFVLELSVSGEKWGRGPINSPLHSSLKNAVESPAYRLAHVVASLADAGGGEIRVEGLHDPILEPSAEDRRLLDGLLDRFGEGGIQAALGLGGVKPAGDRSGRDLLLHHLYTPGLNVNGLYAGYTGPGTEVFTVPNSATARLDLRLPAGLTCDHALTCLKEHLTNHGFDDVEIKVLAAHDWSRTPLDSGIIQAIIATYEAAGLTPAVWPYQGGGGPWSLFRSELGIPLVMSAGLGHGGQRNGVDEFLILDGQGPVAGLLGAQRSHLEILQRFAQSGS